jgi:hypothetical protein
MEQKKSKVVATSLKKEGTGQYGAYFIHLIVFENGDSGDYMAKSNPQTYFKVGLEADYTKESKQNGQYTNVLIKPIQAQGGNGFKQGSPLAQNKRTALECSIRLAAAGKIPTEKIGLEANKFLAWLNDEPKEQAKQNPVLQPPPTKEPEYNNLSSNDDLPF